MTLFFIIFIAAIVGAYFIGPPQINSYDQDWHDRMNDL